MTSNINALFGYVFPAVENSEASGLLAYGGDLAPERVFAAHAAGIFPWYEELPICWWSPRQRAVIGVEGLYVSRRLARRVRNVNWVASADSAFAQVMQGCRQRVEGSWITQAMCESYQALYQRGLAHSIEIWHERRLVGGVYGVALANVFCAESMFFRETDASKVALWVLAHHLKAKGITHIDVQFLTTHLLSLGAFEMARKAYHALLVGNPFKHQGRWCLSEAECALRLS